MRVRCFILFPYQQTYHNIQVTNYLYIYVLNVQLLVYPAHLCFDYSMGCIALIERLLDYRLLIVTGAITIGLILLRRCMEQFNRFVDKRLHLSSYLFQHNSDRTHSVSGTLPTLHQHYRNSWLCTGGARAVFTVDRLLFTCRSRFLHAVQSSNKPETTSAAPKSYYPAASCVRR